MKDFIKYTFASLLGVILAGIVFTILGIVTMVGMVASSDTETIVKENSIFILDLNGTLSERVQENPLQELMGENFNAYGLDDILSSIKKAKEHENIKGIYLQASSLESSFASLEEIRNALKDFKNSGKQVVLVSNLKPAKLRGIPSEGMILCASDAEDKVLKLCTVEPGMEDGAYIR